MDSETTANLSFRVVSVLAALLVGSIWFGVYYWAHHRDSVARNYAPGSVCDHEFEKAHAFEQSIAINGVSAEGGEATGGDGHDHAVADTAAEIHAGELEEFNNIVAGLEAANAAIRSRGQKALFCLPARTGSQELELYEAYWTAAETRIKQDMAVCRREYPADILTYLAATHGCGS
jgi:hypothetical protein